MDQIKLVVVGDGAVGKSCLLITYVNNMFPSDYVPTVFDNYSTNVRCNDVSYSLQLWDTAGQEDYDRLRPLSYIHTDVFLICYSSASPASFENVRAKWLPELRHHCPEAPIVLCATKSDLKDAAEATAGSTARPRQLVPVEDARRLAEREGLVWVECSAVRQTGVAEVFTTAVHLAVHRINTASRCVKKKKSGWGFGSSSSSSSSNRSVVEIAPIPPSLPKAERTPWTNPETSVFAENWKALINNDFAADVRFVLCSNASDGQSTNSSSNSEPIGDVLLAHKIALCAASDLFCNIFGIPTNSDSVPIDTSLQNEYSEKIANGQLPPFTKIEHKPNETVIEVNTNEMPAAILRRVLEFLYTGSVSISGKNDRVKETIAAAEALSIEELKSFCQNILDGVEEFNPSIGTWWNDRFGERAFRLFYNQSERFSDVVLRLEDGQLIHAHKVVLKARCSVLAAMFQGRFMESTQREIDITSVEYNCFVPVIEYLYSDHAMIEDNDSIGILIHANQFGLTRLITLCEIYATKSVERATAVGIENADINICGLLAIAQQHNAQQLAKFCLHFISTNYQPMSKRPEFATIDAESMQYIEEHQWPPKSYLQQLQDYEKALAEYNKKMGKTTEGDKPKCCVM